MHAPSLLVSGLLVVTAMAVPGKRRDRVVRRQDGPVDDGTVADCTFWDTALDQSYTCAYFEEAWGLSHDQFVEYVSHWNSPFSYHCLICSVSYRLTW